MRWVRILGYIFDPNIPLYIQIIDDIKRKIIINELSVGERLPPIRELSQTFGVTVNTLQRALSVLENEKLIHTERTSGKYVTMDARRITDLRNEVLRSRVANTIHTLLELNFSMDEIEESIRTYRKNEEKEG